MRTLTRPLHGDRMVPPGCVDLAVNVVADGPPGWMRAALADVDVSRYPDGRAVAAAVARRHGRPEGSVLLLPGAAEAFWAIAPAVGATGAAIVTPAFTEPATALAAAGVPFRAVPRPAPFVLDPGVVPAEADLVFVTNPCNPTGVLHPARAVEQLARPGRVLVVDEAFMDFVPGEPESLASRTDVPGLVVLRSLTKAFGIPGVRAGYLLADPAFAGRLAAARQPWPLGAHALAALAAFAARDAPAAPIALETRRRRERMHARLATFVEVYAGAANFLCVRVAGPRDVHAQLLDRGLAVRPTADLGLGDNFLRIAVRDDATNDRLIAALQEITA